MEFLEYETPIFCLRRLTQQDRSEKFRLRVSFESGGSNFDISTTVNKIRVISKTINNLFEIDPTTNEYEIHLPTKISNSKEIKNLIEQLLKSTEEKVIIEKDKENEKESSTKETNEKENNNGSADLLGKEAAVEKAVRFDGQAFMQKEKQIYVGKYQSFRKPPRSAESSKKIRNFGVSHRNNRRRFLRGLAEYCGRA